MGVSWILLFSLIFIYFSPFDTHFHDRILHSILSSYLFSEPKACKIETDPKNLNSNLNRPLNDLEFILQVA